MPTNFPVALDSLVNPSPTDDQATVSHSGQHSDINDAMEAVQAKLGIDGSAVTASIDYRVAALEATGAAEIYFRRDDIESTAGGETVISCGGGIYNDGLDVYKDGLLMLVSEYTYSATAVTLGTPATLGDWYSVKYATLDPSAPASVWLTPISLTGTYPDGEVGVPYSHDLTISGGSGSYSNPRASSGTLPAGLSLSIVSGNLRLSGTPTTEASYSFTAAVDSSDGQTAYMPSTVDVAWAPGQLFISGERGAWYDPSDLSTLWKNTAGTVAVTTAGDLVARMDDKSGNGHHMLQTSSGKRPTYQVASGKPYLQFSGGQVLEVAASTTALVPDTNDVLVVNGHQYDSSGDGVVFARVRQGSTAGRYASYRVSGTLTALWDNNTGNSEVNGSDSSTTARVYTLSVDRSVLAIDQRVNGSTFGSASGSTTPDLTSRTPSLRTLIGAYNDSSDTGEIVYFNGRVYGLIIQLDTLSTTQRDKAETWMAAKL